MLFNSIDFAIFLPIVFLLYWYVGSGSLRLRNAILLVASYVFYGWWDARFLLLIGLSTVMDYSIGLLMGRGGEQRHRRYLLWCSVAANLSLLGFFKYFNFFVDSFVDAFSFFGTSINVRTLSIILPVGISFYTFQTMSYTIDVYRRQITPTRDFLAFATFVSFFPQLVAGPIERATNLLPQFLSRRRFDYGQAVDGCRQMLWGLFKKMVVADNCAIWANQIFDSSDQLPGSVLLLGALFFTFQIYGDFSGYSDIAIGTARLFGYDLRQNFAFPYFSRDIGEFWRRWHISLSTWFRDYVYIPLGGSRGGRWIRVRNTFIIFLVSGFWHGANWTFLAWGFVNALLFLPLLLLGRNRTHTGPIAEGRILPTLREAAQILGTFLTVTLVWVFFRAESIGHAFSYLAGIFDFSLFTIPRYESRHLSVTALGLAVLMLLVEWVGRGGRHGLEQASRWPTPGRWAAYLIIIFLIGLFYPNAKQAFIYFQF